TVGGEREAEPGAEALATPERRRQEQRQGETEADPGMALPGRIVGDRAAHRELRLAGLRVEAPAAAHRAFGMALPRLVEGLDQVVVDRPRLGSGQELAHEARLVDGARPGAL